jgi:hypothetical protein
VLGGQVAVADERKLDPAEAGELAVEQDRRRHLNVADADAQLGRQA